MAFKFVRGQMRNFIKSFFEKASSAEQLPEPRLSAEQAISLAQEAARKRGYKDPTDKLDHAFLLFRNDTWLGGPVTLIANDDPPQPYHPSIQFTTMMLVAQHVVDDSDGTIVQLYRAIPLFTEERDLELREGYQALFSAFDRNGIGFAMDLKRKNVGKRK